MQNCGFKTILLVLTKNVRRKIVDAISYDYDYHNTVGVQK